MPSAEVIQVIRTRLQARGDGESELVRIITLLAEVDPMPPSTDHELGRKVSLSFGGPPKLEQY